MQMKNSPITAHANEFDSVVQNKSNRAIIPISKNKKKNQRYSGPYLAACKSRGKCGENMVCHHFIHRKNKYANIDN